MQLNDLVGRKVALWGLGREGRATLEALDRLAAAGGALDVTVVDEAPLDAAVEADLLARPHVSVRSGPAAARDLGRFDVVVKSPGVSLYRPEVASARKAGTLVTSATRIFFAEHAAARMACVTGTKGKSTTASLVAHLLRSLGVRAELRGNIGKPLLARTDAAPDVWVVELSSYQTAELCVDPEVAVLLNLYPDHLDWHGDVDTYYRDKLSLFAGLRRGVAVVSSRVPEAARRRACTARTVTFDVPSGFHASDGAIRDGDRALLETARIPLRGSHNHSNVCAALAAVRELGLDARVAASHVPSFHGLPHRLRPLGERDRILWVDDSISTIPQSTIAALRSYSDRSVTLLVGGFDRGLDYGPLVGHLVRHGVHAVVALPPSGSRIAESLRRCDAGDLQVCETADLDEAVRRARELTGPGGVVLLSPGAPSYGAFRDFAERGDAFARAAGFEVSR